MTNMMIPEDSEIYIMRSKAHEILIEDLNESLEYFPCEDTQDNYIKLGEYKYCITKQKDILEVCVTEDVLPKYWDHSYISARLWFESYTKAVEEQRECIKVFKDVDPHQLMSLLFYFELRVEDYRTLKDAIDRSDETLKRIESDATSISKREIIKFFNQ